ncbi:lipid droplet-regulating VLDL assembly factor AUP1 isoform X3 [Caretta caretta]|uniref:lipid droplet-regulating VLDL assembly factor AUP1 isoform X3 n=1 Tax=Caretta caretta TaxID=8467 RepID=UPI003F4B62A9
MDPPASGPERLFDAHRFPSDGFLLLALLLYAPVGLCLLLLRLFIGIHVFLVSCALPDSLLRRLGFIVRVMCSVLGLFVRQSDPHLRDANVRVYIANHVTHFDHSVISLLTSCNTPALNGTPGFICWSRGFMELGAVGSRAELVDSLKVYSSHGGNPPLLLFPEEAATNGRVGLLRFSSWPFSILDMIQPVALQVQRPLIAVSVADSSWITELFWTFFVPFTVYQVRWMPPVFRQADELNEEFALRVQELLAVELGVISTRLTAADKAEHMKRLRHTPPHLLAPASSQSLVARPRASPSLAGVGPLADEDGRITEMAQRVKEVLPHVSLGTIRRDLAVYEALCEVPCGEAFVPAGAETCAVCLRQEEIHREIRDAAGRWEPLRRPLTLLPVACTGLGPIGSVTSAWPFCMIHSTAVGSPLNQHA